MEFGRSTRIKNNRGSPQPGYARKLLKAFMSRNKKRFNNLSAENESMQLPRIDKSFIQKRQESRERYQSRESKLKILNSQDEEMVIQSSSKPGIKITNINNPSRSKINDLLKRRSRQTSNILDIIYNKDYSDSCSNPAASPPLSKGRNEKFFPKLTKLGSPKISEFLQESFSNKVRVSCNITKDFLRNNIPEFGVKRGKRVRFEESEGRKITSSFAEFSRKDGLRRGIHHPYRNKKKLSVNFSLPR
ncbi:unnamed protein product [Moneuplotes crassus]|uniref:Uncharacterized protein n=1 Tax=Euplotes crassus TaxID=5936 RepID=A0AAD2D015_EUPCR|nr:unnamed protein product [Moneuplotes crassus]